MPRSGRGATKGKTQVTRGQRPVPSGGKPKSEGSERSLLANPTVFVFKVAAGFRVRPAYVAAPSGGSLHIKNLTGNPIQVFQPGPWFVNNGSSTTIQSGDLVTIPLASVSEIVRQPYAVFVSGPDQFAEGESHPEVILEP